MTGSIVTFYSYKGGVGRTLALANTAVTLSRWGYRILCIDWDLDAPGLGFYFKHVGQDSAGIVDLISDFSSGHQPDPHRYTVPVDLHNGVGTLDFIPAGTGGDAYIRNVQKLDWAGLYERGLGEFLENCRDQWKKKYDFVLIDSRTGITDIGGICTVQLPEILVMMFTANEQSLRGTLDVAHRAIVAQDALPYDRAQLMILPVPTRFDAREEYRRAQVWQRRFAKDLAPLIGNWAPRYVPTERLLGHITVPYVSFWSFGEGLPALTETDITPDMISYSLEVLAAIIAHRLDRTELLADSRDSFVSSAARAGQQMHADEQYDVFISYGMRDRGVAGQVAEHLTRRSLRVFLDSNDLAPVANWAETVAKAANNSKSLVALIGQPFDRHQMKDIERFLRQSIDESSSRPLIPVLMPPANRSDLPDILGQYQYLNMKSADEDAIETLAHQIIRVISAAGSPISSAMISGGARDEARAILVDVLSWQLSPLRWRLVEENVLAIDKALDEQDENTLRYAIADLELLSPVRVSQIAGQGFDIETELSMPIRRLLNRLGDSGGP